MNFSKRISLYIVMILIFVSLYQDMIQEHPKHTIQQNMQNSIDVPSPHTFQVVKTKVQPGDTVLSMSEHINNFEPLDVDQVLEDFKLLNPFVDPYQLDTDTMYYFPRYFEPT